MSRRREPDPLYDHPPRAARQEVAKVSNKPRTGIELPELDYEPPVDAEGDGHREDAFDPAIRMAFVGLGQGGGRIAEAFAKLGYARVAALNTTHQDLEGLGVEHRLVIGNNRGGAGKDPEQGRLAAVESAEDIMDLLMRAWGQGVEQCWLTIGGGGGSGSGSWPKVVDLVWEYCRSTDIEKPFGKHVGVIMTLPKRSEGARVQRNALSAVRTAIEMSRAGRIGSLVLVDNARIHELFPRLPVKRFWSVANQNFAAVIHTFNLLAAQNSEYATFDRADLRCVVRNGLMIFGMTRVHRWQSQEDVSRAIRKNLTGTLLAEGFDLSRADMAGAIVVAHDEVLAQIPMENIDYAFASLGRVLGNEGITLHSGIYEGRQEGVRVFTIISGLEPPVERLEELDALSA